MLIIAILLGLVLFSLGVAALVICIRHRAETRSYVKYGLVVGTLLLGLDLAAIALFADAVNILSIPFLVVGVVLSFIQMFLFTCLGMHCCTTLGLPDLPLLRRAVDRFQPVPVTVNRLYFVFAFGVALLGAAYTALLFLAVSPTVSEMLRELTEAEVAREGLGETITPLLVIAVISAAVAEEITFRLCLQSFIARYTGLAGRRYWVAVVITAVLWSIGHIGVLEPEWVKLAQVLPLGIALGFLFRRFGLEAAVLAHGTFNIIGMIVAPSLIGW